MLTDRHKQYLNELRDSGRINMFQAGPWVQSRFGVDANGARKIVLAWMDWVERADAEAAALREDAGMTTSPDRCPADGEL